MSSIDKVKTFDELVTFLSGFPYSRVHGGSLGSHVDKIYKSFGSTDKEALKNHITDLSNAMKLYRGCVMMVRSMPEYSDEQADGVMIITRLQFAKPEKLKTI